MYDSETWSLTKECKILIFKRRVLKGILGGVKENRPLAKTFYFFFRPSSRKVKQQPFSNVNFSVVHGS